jgi:hypothetical protein
MAQITLGALTTLSLSTHLDPMFTDLYGYAKNLTSDASGNVGVGMTPTSGWGASYKAIEVGGSGMAGVWGGGTVGNAFFTANTQFTGAAYSRPATGTAESYILTNGTHVWNSDISAAAGVFTPTQRMLLDNAGNLLVGTNTSGGTPPNGVTINTPASTSSISIGHPSGTASGTTYLYCAYNSTVIGSITQNGTTGVLFNVTSDQRLKEHIADADSAMALLAKVKVRKFDWISDGSHQRLGFIAQELVQVYPEAVHQPADPAEMMAVDYSKFAPLLTKVVQEQQALIETLKARLDAAGID